jgi:S-adenosylmethionine:diacylglycerol 3-amino-3-carboxypropyl transferase
MINILTLNNILLNNIYFNKSVKNNILNNGYFTKINYSDNIIIMSGLYIQIDLQEIHYEHYYNKIKCNFSLIKNCDLIEKIKKLEINIINKFIISKIPQFTLYEQLKNGHIKIYNIKNVNNLFLLRISGIWENDTHYGLTYKIIPL